MLKAAFLHDTDSDFSGGAELSNKAILDVSEQHDVRAVYDNLQDFRKTKQLIRESDFVIINSTVRCAYEFLLIDFLVECGKSYAKWEHDYNFCAKRNAMCFVDHKVKNCCDSERFTAHRKLFAHAKLSVFVSSKQYELHQEIYGEAIQRQLILSTTDAPLLFWEKVKEACCHPEPVEGWSGQTPCFDKLSMTPALSVKQEKKLRWKNVLVFKSFGGLGDFLFVIPAINKIASVSENISVCTPFALYGLFKKQLPQYEIYPEDYINKANHTDYDKIIDLSNYPSYRGDAGTYKMPFPSYRRIKQQAFRHYLDGVATLHPDIDNSFERFPYFTSAVTPNEKYFTVHPGAGFEAKYWPAYKYGKLISTLLDLFGDLHCKLILGPTDPKPEELFEKIPEGVSIPKGNLEAIGDVLAGALFHVGNDSGMTHLAGVFNTPTVTIHGPTGPGTWMSFAEHKEVIWGKQGVCNIPCNYDVAINCAHRICLNSVTPQRVLKHVLKLLQNTLPETTDCRFIFNPEVVVEKFPDSFILKINEKELLVEFSEASEIRLFEKLIENKLRKADFSDSLEKVAEVFIENELLFRIPELPEDFSKSKRTKQPVDVTLVSHVKKRDSIGRHGILFAEMLHENFSINGITTREPNPEDIDTALYKKITRSGAPGKLALFTDVLQHNNRFTPYKRVPKEAEIKICYSMFESSAIPAEWASIINKNFDGVWVPDKWLVNVYKKSGVEKPVNVLPLACDLKNFLEQPLKQKANDVFTFGVSSGIWMRKNVLGVIEAFKRAFPDENEKVQLRIHSRYGFPAEVEKLRTAIDNDSRIELAIKPVSDKTYLKFMCSLDAYILLSMGEGFSITPREAMALGLPVIVSDNTAHRTICESGLAHAVPTIAEIPGYYEAFRKAHGSFFVPDAEVAAQQMREIFEHRNEIYIDAQQRRIWAAQYDTANLKEQYIKSVREVLTNGFHENS